MEKMEEHILVVSFDIYILIIRSSQIRVFDVHNQSKLL